MLIPCIRSCIPEPSLRLWILLVRRLHAVVHGKAAPGEVLALLLLRGAHLVRSLRESALPVQVCLRPHLHVVHG